MVGGTGQPAAGTMGQAQAAEPLDQPDQPAGVQADAHGVQQEGQHGAVAAVAGGEQGPAQQMNAAGQGAEAPGDGRLQAQPLKALAQGPPRPDGALARACTLAHSGPSSSSNRVALASGTGRIERRLPWRTTGSSSTLNCSRS